jgi:hypothetical protein
LLSVGLLAGSASAGTLSTATWTQLVSDAFYGPGGSYTYPITLTTAQLSVSGTSTGSSIAVSLTLPQLTASFFVPKTQPNGVTQHVRITLGGAQMITATASMAQGAPGIPGSVLVRTAVHALGGPNASMYQIGQNGLVLPLLEGAAAQNLRTFVLGGITHSVISKFYGWTVDTRTFTGLTTFGIPLPDVVAMGSFNLTAAGGGTVNLVSPSRIFIREAGSGSLGYVGRDTVRFSSLKLSFVPEPGAWLLLGTAGLALLRWRRSAHG